MRMILLASTALACAITAAPAFAQEADDGANSSDIIVTARKREENLVDVPLAISVTTAAQLQRDQVYNLNDLQRLTPALEVSQTFGGETNGGGRLRGLGTGVFNPSVSSSVALVIDQTPVGNLSFPQVYDLAQVEVLRGPQGTLFGQGASAGVINITTKAPSTAGFAANASVDFADKGTAGSEVGELIVNAGVNMPLSDTAALRVATQYKTETGLQRSVTTKRDNKITDFGIRARLKFDASETVTINLAGEYGKNTSDGQTFFALATAPNVTTPFGPPGSTLASVATAAYLSPTGCAMTVISARVEEYCEGEPTNTDLSVAGVSAVIDMELSDEMSLTSVTAFRKRQFRVFHRNFTRLSTAASAQSNRVEEDSNGFSQELRAAYDGEKADFVVGAFYTQFRFDRKPIGAEPFVYGVNTPGNRIGFSVCNVAGTVCPVPTNYTDENTRNRTWALFADGTVDLAEQFKLFGGLRFDNFQNTTTVQILRATAGPIETRSAGELSLSGRLGVSYRPNPDTNIYLSYSRGYKPTAVGTSAAGTLFELKPEKVNAFELGAKFKVGGMQLAANIFHTKIFNFQSQRNEIVGTQLVSVPFFYTSPITSKGFEFTAFGEVAPGLSINAGYQFNDIKFPKGIFGEDAVDRNGDRVFDDNVFTGLPFKLDDRQFINAPKHKFTLSAEYAAGLSDSMEAFFTGNIVYKSAVLLGSRANPAYVYPAHEVINLGFGLRNPDNRWTASVFVRNLTKEREPMAYLAGTFAGQTDGSIRAWPIAGLTARVVGIRAGFDF